MTASLSGARMRVAWLSIPARRRQRFAMILPMLDYGIARRDFRDARSVSIAGFIPLAPFTRLQLKF